MGQGEDGAGALSRSIAIHIAGLTPRRQAQLDAINRELIRGAEQASYWARRRCRTASLVWHVGGITQQLLDGGYCLDRMDPK